MGISVAMVSPITAEPVPIPKKSIAMASLASVGTVVPMLSNCITPSE